MATIGTGSLRAELNEISTLLRARWMFTSQNRGTRTFAKIQHLRDLLGEKKYSPQAQRHVNIYMSAAKKGFCYYGIDMDAIYEAKGEDIFDLEVLDLPTDYLEEFANFWLQMKEESKKQRAFMGSTK